VIVISVVSKALSDLEHEVSDEEVVVWTDLGNAVVSVSPGEDAIDVVLVDAEGRMVLDERGCVIGSTPVSLGAGWEGRLRERVEGVAARSGSVMTCSCGEFMVLDGERAVCVECPREIERSCPDCGSSMQLLRDHHLATFWGCSSYPVCRRASRWSLGPQRVGEAEALLDLAEGGDYGDKMALFGAKLREILAQDRERALAMILGTRTPTGKRTLEAIIRERDAEIASARERRQRRRATRAGADLPEDPFKGLDLYGPPPEGIGLGTVVEIPKEGGPTEPASSFKYHELRHDVLNPMQAAVLPWVDKNVNLVVATKTSTGKTTVAEMMGADALARNGKVVFLSPLRAVSQEKYDDWTHEDHPWSEHRIEILTGDYSLSSAKRKRLKRSRVIVMTSEMLDSKTRRMANEGNDWLLRVLCLVVDEAHLLTMEGRGDALEAGVMRFSQQNPHARIVFLSATMPNVDELGGWLTRLNGKPSVVVRSDWRPTELTVHWPTYLSMGNNYHKNEESKREAAMDLLTRYSRDKWIVFVHSKKAGRALLSELRADGERVEFHSADLDRASRAALEKAFRHGNLRICIATSTLAYGINMPARRVLVLGVHRGLQEVDPIDVAQEVGRAGRVGLDPRGDAYVLLPEDPSRPSKTAGIRMRFQKVGRILSRLNDVDVLAFHLTAEVSEGDVESEQQAVAWHDRSLAAYQGQFLVEDGTEVSAGGVMARLARAGILKRTGLRYEPTMLGRVSSWLYYSPFDISDWAGNFRRLTQLDRLRSDVGLAWAVGCVKTMFDAWTPREAQSDLSDVVDELRAIGIDQRRLPPMVLAIDRLLSGETYKPLVSDQRAIAHDASRISQALSLIDKHVLRCLGQEYCDLVGLRLRYGCSWDEADLCRLPGIGAKRASILIDEGVCSVEDVVANEGLVREALGKKLAAGVIARARELVG